MSSYFDNVGKQTEINEAGVAAAPAPGTNSGGIIIQNVEYENNSYQATAQAETNIVSPNPSYESHQFDQFEDAPEENTNNRNHHLQDPSPSITSRGQVHAVAMSGAPTAPSSLDALALACAQQERDESTSMDVSTGTSTPVVSNMSTMTNDSAASTDKSSRNKTVAPNGNGSSGNDSVVFEISDSDVLCGRGGLTNHHPGNVFFRRMVRMKQESYLRATKRDKAGVARDIVDTIRRLDPPGRFLKKDPSNPGQWVEIGNRKAREKTSQALREGAPELREELGTGNNGTQPKQVQQVPVSLESLRHGVFTTASITAAEQKQALEATKDCIPRGRVVSSDSMNGSGWTKVNLDQYQDLSYQVNNGATSQPHIVVDETSGAAVATVTPPTLTPSASSSSAEPMDTSAGGSTTPPPVRNYCGNKRKLEEAVQNQACSWQDMQEDAPSPTGSSSKQRGPRMKLLKARMMDCR